MCGAPYESIVKVIISLMDEAVQQGMKQNYDHHLSLKKKDFIIQGLKSFNDFQKKTAVTKNLAIKKTDGLSDAERQVFKSLSK
jgi:hypothetical protein|tara:strand:+ start:418 stop:666 length:249 start_codon:yes stop_codon:yes gene_type:complete